MRRRLLAGAIIVLLLALGVGFIVGPGIVDRGRNKVEAGPKVAVTDEARALHKTLVIADMHADELLWGRDPLERANHGHVDLPRLQDGNVALQVFSVVTKTPRDMNYDHNTGETDNITLLAILQRWPMSTWTSLRARAVYQASRLHDAVARSNGALVLITDDGGTACD